MNVYPGFMKIKCKLCMFSSSKSSTTAPPYRRVRRRFILKILFNNDNDWLKKTRKYYFDASQ